MNVCGECGVEMKHSSSLRRHLVEKHNEKYAPRKGGFRCPACGTVSQNNQIFEVHLLQEHNFIVKVESISFESEAKFIQWKRLIEESSPTKFVVRHSKRSSDKRTVNYRCNRDGPARTRVNSGNQQRKRKFQGSRKIDAHCPARITAAIFPNGSVEVTFSNSHFGHNLQVAHTPIPSPGKKLRIVKVASKVPFKYKEQDAALSDYSDLGNDVCNSQVLIIDEGNGAQDISLLVGTSSSKRSSSSSTSDCDLKKQIMDTVKSTLDSCQTREDLLTLKRIANSMQPIINASSSISFKPNQAVNIGKCRVKIKPKKKLPQTVNPPMKFVKK